jgi:hypothetical protein
VRQSYSLASTVKGASHGSSAMISILAMLKTISLDEINDINALDRISAMRLQDSRWRPLIFGPHRSPRLLWRGRLGIALARLVLNRV